MRIPRDEVTDEAWSKPATVEEEAVADAFGEILDTEPVGRTDSVVSLGGTSLDLVSIAEALVTRFGPVDVVSALRAGTVATVASLIARSIEPRPD